MVEGMDEERLGVRVTVGLLHTEPAFLEGGYLTHELIHIHGDSTPWQFIPGGRLPHT